MTRLKLCLQILFFSLIPLVVCSQPKILLDELEKAWAGNQPEKTDSLYVEFVLEMTGQKIAQDDFDRFLEITHKLSATGYAKTVVSSLWRLTEYSEPDSVKHIKILTELGYATFFTYDFQRADSLFQTVLALQHRTENVPPLDVAYSNNFLGIVNKQLGNYKLAIDYFEKAKNIRIRELGENDPKVGGTFNNLGLVYEKLNDFDNALTNFEKAVEIKLASQDSSVYLNYMNLGTLLSDLGNYSSALEYFTECEKILQKLDSQEKLADLYLNTGAVYYLLRAGNEAYDYLNRALAIYTSVWGENNEKVSKVYQNLANVYEELEDYENEQKSIEKAISILENIYGENSLELAPLYNNLGLTYKNHSNYERSLFSLNNAAQIYRSATNGQSEKYLNTLSNIGQVYSLMNEPDSAIYYFSSSLEEQQKLYDGKHPFLANSCNKLSEIYYSMQDYEKADYYVRQAFAANIPNNVSGSFVANCLDPACLFESFLWQGKILSELRQNNFTNFDKAMYSFSQADSVLSAQRNFMFSKKDKINLARNSKKLAGAVLESLSKSEQLTATEMEKAFRFIEKSKNLVLFQSISVNQGKSFAGIPDSILRAEETMLGRINFFTHQIELENDIAMRSDLQERLFVLKQKHKNLVQSLEENYPSYYSLKYDEHVPVVADVLDKLDNKTLILSYFISESSLFRLSVSKQKNQLDKLPVANFDYLLTGMRKGITLRLDSVYLESAHQLYELLIPHNISPETESIIIIPDGSLSVLPFEALLSENEKVGSNPGHWSYLVKNYNIRYSPSFALWLKLQDAKQAKKEKDNLLALAPVFDAEKLEDTAVLKPEFHLVNNEYNVKLKNTGLPPLQATENEVQKVSAIFRNNSCNSELFLYSEASEQSFLSRDLTPFSYIHIATHGFVDKANPDLSGLFFAPVSASGFDDVLYTSEIYNLKINAELVTLSACETGLGKVAEGEGILGFSRAFLFSGARNLLLSLWKVNDNSTSRLMTSFYNFRLAEKKSLTESLARAKNELIEEGDYSHPYYWSAFVLIGN